MAFNAAAVLGLLGSLPNGANPYQALRDYASNSLNPSLPPSYGRQLVAIAVLFLISLLFICGSLVVRILNKTFWIVHFSGTPRLWRPHFSISWSLWACLFLILMEVLVVDSIKLSQRAAMQRDYAAWRLFAWLPACYGGWTALWSTTVSYLLHLHAYGRAGMVDRAAPFVSAASAAVPIIFSLVFVPLAALASVRFSQSMDAFYSIDSLLEEHAQAYHGESALAELLPTGLPLIQELERRTDSYLRSWTVSLYVAASFGLVLVALLMVVAILYIAALRRVLRVTSWQTESGSTRASSVQPLRRTYANMAITISVFLILGLTTSCTVIVMAAMPNGFTEPVPAQIFTLLPFYAFATLGLPSSIILFVRAFDQTRDKTRSRTRISVNVEVTSYSEGPLPPSPALKRHSLAAPYSDARRGLALPAPESFKLMQRLAAEGDPGYPHRSLSLGQAIPTLEVARISQSSFEKELRPFEEYTHFALSSPLPCPARPDSERSFADSSFGDSLAGREPLAQATTRPTIDDQPRSSSCDARQLRREDEKNI